MKHRLQDRLQKTTATPATDLAPADRERLMLLGADLDCAWHSAGVTRETRKRIVRTLIDEIVVRVEDATLDLVIRWHGGDHSSLKVKKNRSGQHRWSAPGETVDLMRVLARQDAGQSDRVGAQPCRQDDGTGQRLDAIARVQPAQPS